MTTSHFLIRFLCYGSIPVFVATVAMAFTVVLGGTEINKQEGTNFVAAGGSLVVIMLVASLFVGIGGAIGPGQ